MSTLTSCAGLPSHAGNKITNLVSCLFSSDLSSAKNLDRDSRFCHIYYPVKDEDVAYPKIQTQVRISKLEFEKAARQDLA